MSDAIETGTLLKHFVSTVFLVTEEDPCRTLLLFHKKLNVWLPSGGHIESFENPYEAAVRETKEETGIDITGYLTAPIALDDRAWQLPLPVDVIEEVIPAHKEKPEHRHIDFVYIVRVPYQAVQFDADESEQAGWFTKEEAFKLRTFANIHYFFNKIWP